MRENYLISLKYWPHQAWNCDIVMVIWDCCLGWILWTIRLLAKAAHPRLHDTRVSTDNNIKLTSFMLSWLDLNKLSRINLHISWHSCCMLNALLLDWVPRIQAGKRTMQWFRWKHELYLNTTDRTTHILSIHKEQHNEQHFLVSLSKLQYCTGQYLTSHASQKHIQTTKMQSSFSDQSWP